MIGASASSTSTPAAADRCQESATSARITSCGMGQLHRRSAREGGTLVPPPRGPWPCSRRHPLGGSGNEGAERPSEGECFRLLGAGGVGRVAVNAPTARTSCRSTTPSTTTRWVPHHAVLRPRHPRRASSGWRSRSTTSTTSGGAAGAWCAAGPGEWSRTPTSSPRSGPSGTHGRGRADCACSYIRLRWDRLTGRQIGEGWSPTDEPPVRRVL